MAAQVIEFLTSKIDPVQFFSGSSSGSSSVFPYAISAPGHSNDFLGDSPVHSDLAAFTLRNYVLAVLSSPLQLVETLSEVQYQRREDGEDPTAAAAAANDALSKQQPASAEQSGALVVAGDHQLEPLQNGVWDNLREIVESEGEGWTSLMKGHFTNFAFTASYAVLQPALEEAINDVLDVYEDTHPATLIASHVFVGGLLSPLELVRTRLIVQPSSSNRKKYYGPFHALHGITTEEHTGLGSLYSLRHLIPSLIISGLSPLLRAVSKIIIQEELGLDPTFTPVLHHLATLALMAVEVGIVTPFEMARKRLQIQWLTPQGRASSQAPQAFETSVVVSPRYYSGIFDCISSIVAEEGGRSRRRRRRKRVPSAAGGANLGIGTEWHQVHDLDGDYRMYDVPGAARRQRDTGLIASMGRFASGVRTLYRGFWARYATRVVVYAFDEISQNDDGW
ncbi:mitochondrial carrier domain-containing protein [Geranomyces variabilis]|nr:mitochondrial carrier domain-containing protein [Geranomyces variabilis]KAJ3134072.1 hypothetical protein HDU90_005420 [Geranomyces variabilis]